MQQVANNRRAPESPETWGGFNAIFPCYGEVVFCSLDVFVESVVGVLLAELKLQCSMILQCFHGGETELIVNKWGHRLKMRYLTIIPQCNACHPPRFIIGINHHLCL